MVLFFKDKNELIYSVDSVEGLDLKNISKLEWLFVATYLKDCKVVPKKYLGGFLIRGGISDGFDKFPIVLPSYSRDHKSTTIAATHERSSPPSSQNKVVHPASGHAGAISFTVLI